MDAEIIAVGSELLTPHHTDTNSLFLTDKLNQVGIEVRLKTIVGDDRERLASVFRAALGRSKLIILTGGLGPTEDDLNREVVAQVLALPLREVPEIRLRLVGLPESEVDQRIAPIYKPYANPATTILAVSGSIEVHLRAHAASEEAADALLAELADKIELDLGDHVFSAHGETLEEVVGMFLGMKEKTLAVAESCTGGLLAERLTRAPGSSNFFLGGALCYSDALKTRLAGVAPKLLEEHGAVSKPVARAMAEGIRKNTGAAIGVGITGIAGPDGGTPEKPVGLVFVSLADERGTQVREFRFPGDRARVRLWATQAALEIIRRRVRS